MIRKLLIRFGWVPRALATELSNELSKSLAVNAELRDQLVEKDARIENLIGTAARLQQSHDRLKEHHETQQRAVSKMGQALRGRIPINVNRQ